MALFNVYHVNPIKLNEKTSGEIVDLFVRDLDDRAIIITEIDFKRLTENENDFLNQVYLNNNIYLEKATNVYLEALKTADSILTVLTGKALDFKENDTLYRPPYDTKILFYSPGIKISC